MGAVTLRLFTCPRPLTQGATEPPSDAGWGELRSAAEARVTGRGGNRPTAVWGPHGGVGLRREPLWVQRAFGRVGKVEGSGEADRR